MKPGCGYLQSNFRGFAIWLFGQGLNACQISSEIGGSPSAVSRWLKAAGCNLHISRKIIKTKRILNSFDKTFFEKIDNEEKAWVLGVLYADGSNSGQNLRLSMVDLDIVEKVKRLMGFTGEIKIVRPKASIYKTSYQINICGKKNS